MRRTNFLAALAAALFLASAVPTIADNGAVVSKVPFSDKIFNVCDNEVVDVAGTLTVSILSFLASNGSIHMSSHGIIIADAVGETSGFTYLYRSGAANEINVDSTFTTGEFTLTQTDALIGQGRAPNLLLKSLNHMTVNANGEVTAFHVSGSFICH